MKGIDHKTKINLIKSFIFEEDLKNPRIWGREVKLLNEILPKYPDLEFWVRLNLGYKIHSFAFFKTERGILELKSQYTSFKAMKSERNVLDNSPKLVNTDELVTQGVLEGIEKKETALDWLK